jgi:hypothetical protein
MPAVFPVAACVLARNAFGPRQGARFSDSLRGCRPCRTGDVCATHKGLDRVTVAAAGRVIPLALTVTAAGALHTLSPSALARP